MIATAADFWAHAPEEYIAIHCAYGFNRTGCAGGLESGVQGLGVRVQGLEFRVRFRFQVKGLGFRV